MQDPIRAADGEWRMANGGEDGWLRQLCRNNVDTLSSDGSNQAETQQYVLAYCKVCNATSILEGRRRVGARRSRMGDA